MKNSDNKQKVVLGIDLGTNWHGVSGLLAIDDNDETKNHFITNPTSYWVKGLSDPQSGTYKKGERGNYRRTRRTISRNKQRRVDFDKLVRSTNAFNFDIETVKTDSTYDIYKLAFDGLTKELKPDELYKVLYKFVKNRGSGRYIPNQTDKPIVEVLYEISSSNERVRGKGGRLYYTYSHNDETGEVIKSEKKTTTFEFSRRALKKDLAKILANVSYLNDDFKEKYLSFFDRQRDFATGPGSEKSPTEYGCYQVVDGKITKTKDNLWETSIAKCPVFSEERAAFKGCLTNELAEFTSQLSFLRINGEKLNQNQKELIWSQLLATKTAPSEKSIRKWLQLTENEKLSNFKSYDSKGAPKMESLKIFRDFLKENIIMRDVYEIPQDEEIFISSEDIGSELEMSKETMTSIMEICNIIVPDAFSEKELKKGQFIKVK